MTNPIRGLVAVTSDYGVGKTEFALGCGYEPEDMIFINDDVKETGFEEEFGQYIDLIGTSSGMTVLQFHNYCIELIDKIEFSKVIIWDTWTQFAGTFGPYVKANPTKFRASGQYSSNGKIKSGEQYNDAYRYEGAAISALKSKCDLLILTFHLKQRYIKNEPIPDSYKPGHDRAISKYADLRIWLTPNPNSQVPVGLIMKNISRRTVEKGKGIMADQVLPLRLETCNWENILHYWEVPIGNRVLENHERPNEFELSLISGTLTPENKRMYEAGVELAKISEQIEDQEQIAAIKEALSKIQDLPIPAKVKTIENMIDDGTLIYDGEINRDQITKWSIS